MNVLEKEIEDLIWHGITHDRVLLHEKGLYIHGYSHYLRQFDIGNYGRVDLAGFHVGPKVHGLRRVAIHIIEIKKDIIDVDTFLQSLRYFRGISQLVRENFNDAWVDTRITLLGKTVDKSSGFIYISDLNPNIELTTYTLDFKKGILFNSHKGYSLVDEKLPSVEFLKPIVKERVRREFKEDLPF